MVNPAENPKSTDGPLPHHARHAVEAECEVTARLVAEFQGTHPPELVSRCVIAARHGAEDVIGSRRGEPEPIEPDLIERVARQHLRVLATVDAEMGGKMTLRHTP